MSAPAAGGPDDLPIDVDLIKVLASDTRRDILRHLGDRRHTLTELAERLNLKKATILEHLEKLVAGGLIRRLDEGERLWVYYELTPRGKRLVHPGRTRFYLILAGSAAAAVVLAAFVAFAFFAGPSVDDQVDMRADATLSDSLLARPPTVVWRGFDADVRIPIEGPVPEGATLIAAGQSIPVVNGTATLDAARIDALPPGAHPLWIRSAVGDAPLDATLDVRDAPVALVPLTLPQGPPASLVLSLGTPGHPPPADLAVHVDGEPAELTQSGRDVILTLQANATGEVDVQVGRLTHLAVEVVPTLALVGENGTLRLAVGDVPLADANVSIDGAPAGTTDANGTLSPAWPEPGERGVSAETNGVVLQRAVVFDATSARVAEPRLTLDAYHAAPPGQRSALDARVAIKNAGLVPEVVTLVARSDGAAVASTLVHVPAGATVTATLAAPIGVDRPISVEALAAGSSRATTTGTYSYAGGGEAQDSAAPPATQPTPAEPYAAARGFQGLESRQPPDASTMLLPPPLPPTPVASSAAGGEAAPSAAVPAPGVALVAAAVALALFARRRR